MRGRCTLERNQTFSGGNRRHNDAVAGSQHCRSGRGLRISGAQMRRANVFLRGLASQQILGVQRRHPAAIFGNADRNNFIFRFIDCLQDRCRREQRNFMFAAASAEKNSYPQFFHSLYSAVLTHFAQIELFWRRLGRQNLH